MNRIEIKPVEHMTKGENGNDSKNIVQKWDVDENMQVFWVYTMCGRIARINIVAYEIQWCHHKIIDDKIQKVNFR